MLAAAPAPAIGQRAPAQPRAAAVQAPDLLTASKLLWSTMAAVDQANKTGNYSVLRDLGSRGFQQLNDAPALAVVFAEIRRQRFDLADTLVVAPTWEIPPTVVEPGIMRMRGRFQLRPNGVAFDLLYQWDQGWRLHGISILPYASAPQQR